MVAGQGVRPAQSGRALQCLLSPAVLFLPCSTSHSVPTHACPACASIAWTYLHPVVVVLLLLPLLLLPLLLPLLLLPLLLLCARG